ncbi:DUF3352 domain-containing protein [Myxosarcina sp. GI1]|uniref:DUF3352 domain-containing protein n=1 Tax=Myxosarcina sp. GI1 TaxID=1541065 RepID=UPI00055DEA76|nr:DUF3352 domain-containing protein [Myxosarcina sp. GI1]
MKPRSFFTILTTGAIAVFVVAAVGFFWIIGRSPLSLLGGGVVAYPQAALFISKQAPAAISLLVNPEKLDALRQLSVPISKRRQSRLEWDELKTNLLAQTGLDYRRDIKPWLGEEITLAITSLDYDRNPNNGVQPGYLLATATKDTELAKEFLQISLSEGAISESIDLAYEKYKGVNIIYQRSLAPEANPSIWANAVVGDFVLFANHPEVLRQAINNAQAIDLSLARADFYQTALETIYQPRIGLAYLNLPGVSAWLDKAAVPQTTEKQTLTVTLAVKRAGVAAETALIGVKNESDRTPALSEPVTALSYLPANNVVAVAGTNLDDFWQKIQAGLNPQSPLAQLANQIIASIETPLKIDLAEDIFSWVKGEYALALLSSPENSSGWLFVAENTASEDITEAIAHLDSLARQQGLSVGEFPVGDTNVTAWTRLKTASKPNSVSLNAEVRGAHAVTDNYVILADSLETVALALDSRNSFLSNPEFQKIVASLPSENDGYVYVNYADGKAFLERELPIIKAIELSAQSLLAHIKAIALSSQGSKAGVRRATVVFELENS